MLLAAGGRFLARGMPAHVYFEAGARERTVVLEFPSVAAAVAAYNSAAYQAALMLLAALPSAPPAVRDPDRRARASTGRGNAPV